MTYFRHNKIINTFGIFKNTYKYILILIIVVIDVFLRIKNLLSKNFDQIFLPILFHYSNY